MLDYREQFGQETSEAPHSEIGSYVIAPSALTQIQTLFGSIFGSLQRSFNCDLSPQYRGKLMKSITISSSWRSLWIAALVAGALTGANAAIAHAGTTASRELGQPDFIHSASNTVDPQTLSLSFSHAGVAVDTSANPNHLYVTDSG